MVFNAFFSCIFKLYLGSQCNYHCFPGVFTSSPHSILSKPLAAFPYNYCRINGQWVERGINPVRILRNIILAEPRVEPATSCSQVLYATDCAIGALRDVLGTFILRVFIPRDPMVIVKPIFVNLLFQWISQQEIFPCKRFVNFPIKLYFTQAVSLLFGFS